MMTQSGAALTQVGKFQELKYQVDDNEAEWEQRDFSIFCKSAIVIEAQGKPKHNEFACIGTQTCNKQKNVPKLFVENLKALDNAHSVKKETIQGTLRQDHSEQGSICDQACADFISLMDHITARKKDVRRELHMRDDLTKLAKSSTFNSCSKAQGGGIYG